MPTRFSAAPPLLLCALLATATLLTGCLSFGGGADDDYQAAPRSIAYADVDRRAFTDLGEPVLTKEGLVAEVEATRHDTLLWFEQAQNGRFEQAFLRRGNTVYTLGPQGDYLQASSTQSAVYSIFMDHWRRAQASYALAGR